MFPGMSCTTCTHAKLDRDREEVALDLGSDLLAAGNARQVDVAGLNKTLFALDGPEDLLGKAMSS